MNTEEENEGRNLQRRMADFPTRHRGERLKFMLTFAIDCPEDENPLFPSFAAVQLLFLK